MRKCTAGGPPFGKQFVNSQRCAVADHGSAPLKAPKPTTRSSLTAASSCPKLRPASTIESLSPGESPTVSALDRIAQRREFSFAAVSRKTEPFREDFCENRTRRLAKLGSRRSRRYRGASYSSPEGGQEAGSAVRPSRKLNPAGRGKVFKGPRQDVRCLHRDDLAAADSRA